VELVKAPLRVSYVGGGTDYPEFFNNNEGAGVIAAAINQYVYVYSHPLSDFAEENIRFTYRGTESVVSLTDLKHPVMREMLREVDWSERTNFGTFADLPSGVGLGGSSSFAVALATLIFEKRKMSANPHEIAKFAIRIEREVLKEAGGVQDQYVAAFGGLRKYGFKKDEVVVSESLLDLESLAYLEERQMLVWLGESRDSSTHAEHTRSVIKSSKSLLGETVQLLQITENALLESKSPLESYEALRVGVLHGWELKKEFTSQVHPSVIEVETIIANFPKVSMKLCGAGGSGFILILGEPETLQKIQGALANKKSIRPKVELLGSKLLTSPTFS
jgi:D-glycero-alpha-D-manno-heptose-7-phosphate kinase